METEHIELIGRVEKILKRRVLSIAFTLCAMTGCIAEPDRSCLSDTDCVSAAPYCVERTCSERPGEQEPAQEDMAAECEVDALSGALDVCDGLDNDCDGAIDSPIACSSISDCPEDRPDDTLFFCENSVCVLKPSRQPVGAAECQKELECVSGVYEAVPVACL